MINKLTLVVAVKGVAVFPRAEPRATRGFLRLEKRVRLSRIETASGGATIETGETGGEDVARDGDGREVRVGEEGEREGWDGFGIPGLGGWSALSVVDARVKARPEMREPM